MESTEIRQLPTWEILGMRHILIMLGTLLVVLVGLYLMRRIETNHKTRWERIIAVIFLVRQVISYFLAVAFGDWGWFEYLPLHLCDINATLCAIMLINRSQSLFEISLYFGIPGALNALFTPVLIHGDATGFVIDYFLGHVCIFIPGFYAIYEWKMKPRKHSWWKTYLIILIFVFIPVSVINWFSNTNYMYTLLPPYEDHPFVFGPWPYYLIGFHGLALVFCWLMYMLFKERPNTQ